MTSVFAPGDLVYARGREWVTLPSPDDDTLYLRPLSGAEADVQVIHPALEREPARPAQFALPGGSETATQESARGLPASQTLFDAHPFTVVSLDYIKAERRRDSFARSCPALVVVDEAHACVGTHQSRQQRFELLKRLASEPARHLILLTATPHSGDEAAFERLLSLLDPEFEAGALDSDAGRARLARHFVQRRRIDITTREWGEERVFPRHETA